MKKMMDVHPFILPRALSIFAGLVLALGLPTGAMAQGGGSEEGGADAQKGSARLTKPPKLVQTVEADYTQAAIDARAEGPVRLKLTISATGEVTKVEILEGPGYGLNEAAAKAAEQFIFEPAEINNVPSPVILDFVLNFELPILPSAFTGKVIDRFHCTVEDSRSETSAKLQPGRDSDPGRSSHHGDFLYRDHPFAAHLPDIIDAQIQS